MIKAINRFIWRIKFTVYGQRKTGWGWRNWWEWSAINHDELDGSEWGWRECADGEIDAALS